MRYPSFDAVRGFDQSLYIVAGGQLVNIFGSGLVHPFATIYFHLEVGIALSLVGLGLLANNIARAVATAIGGYLSDHVARKPIMVASMAGNAGTLSAYAFVTEIATLIKPVNEAGAFILVATVAGLTGGLYTPAAEAYIADLTTGKERDQAYSLLKVANNVGFGTGFVVGGLLYEWASVAVFIVDGLTSAIVALVLLFFISQTQSRQSNFTFKTSIDDWKQAITKRRVLGLAGLNIGFAVMYAQMQTTIPVVVTDTLGLSAAQMGTLFILNPLTLVLFQIPVVDAISTWRRTRGLIVAAGFWGASMIVIWCVYIIEKGVIAFNNQSLLILGVVLVGGHLVLRTLGEILHSPLATSLMSDLGTNKERGSQLSLLEIAKRAGFGIGSFIGGVFFDYGVAAWLWPTLAGVCGCIAIGFLLLEPRVTASENGVAVTN